MQNALEEVEADFVGIYVILDYKIFPGSPSITLLVTLGDIIAVAKNGNHLSPSVMKELETFGENAPQSSRHNGGIAGIGL